MSNPLLPTLDPVRAERRWAVVLFFITCASVFLVRFVVWPSEPAVSFGDRFVSSALFAGTLMGILLAHEMGHFVVAKLHSFMISWPLFIPFPYFVGTLGAFIRFKDKPPHRSGLIEMAASGPVAGVVAIVVSLSVWAGSFEPVQPAEDEWVLGTPIIFSVIRWCFGVGETVAISMYDPIAFAAWIGCLITALNLLPFGQLDGGHIVSGIWPEQARTVSWLVTGCLLVGGFFWAGWPLWAAVLHLIGSRHPVDVRGNRLIVSARARWIAGFCAFIFCLCFVPIPFR